MFDDALFSILQATEDPWALLYFARIFEPLHNVIGN